MTLTPLLGHLQVRERISAAINADKLPQVLLVTGPPGVGKQRLALWLAQRLMCEVGSDEPCGSCISCKRVLGLIHPDVHWLVPIPRPKATEPDKQIDEAAGLLEEAIAERRTTGKWTGADGMASHGIASARLLQRRASLTASAGGWRVFIIGRAERLVPQESSQQAANALLKLLEEPPARSVFILTTTAPGLVLPTIRSRAVPLRVGRLEDNDVLSWAEQNEVEADGEKISAARGAPGRLLVEESDGDRRAQQKAAAVLDAIEQGPMQRAQVAVKQGVSQARGEFTDMLDALAELLNERAHTSAGKAAGQVKAQNAVAGVELVLEAREKAQGNTNPQLLTAVLMNDLAGLVST